MRIVTARLLFIQTLDTVVTLQVRPRGQLTPSTNCNPAFDQYGGRGISFLCVIGCTHRKDNSFMVMEMKNEVYPAFPLLNTISPSNICIPLHGKSSFLVVSPTERTHSPFSRYVKLNVSVPIVEDLSSWHFVGSWLAWAFLIVYVMHLGIFCY